MYQASEGYIEQMMHKGTRRRITGTVGNISFTGGDIVRDSFSITNRATDESETKIGGVYLGQIELTFIPSFLTKIARNEFKDKELEISIGLWVPDEDDEIDGGEWEDIPVGVFTLQAPKISKQGVTVTGYDHMKKLDKSLKISQTTATPYSFLQFIGQECGVSIGNTQAEIEAMPNGTESLAMYEENDIETYRDLLYWLAQTLGGFATANREGAIEIRKLGTETGIELDEMHRDTDVIFSGYETKWTGVSFLDIQTKTTKYYGMEIDDGLTMNLGANPLLQLGTYDTVENRRRAVLNAVAQIRFTPFYCNSARDPIFDLGDQIEFTGGISGDSTGCVMAFTYTGSNFTFEGFGDDPDLANAKSKTDKDISGLMQSTQENEVTYYIYKNLEEISIQPDTEVTIASLAFTSAQTTTVKIMHEFLFDFAQHDLTEEGSYELHYYLDGELLTYKPRESLSAIIGTVEVPVIPELIQDEETEEKSVELDPVDISITRDFFYVLRDVAPNQRHTWTVKVIAHGIGEEEMTIGEQNAHVILEGQRLYGEEYFDGHIEVKEDIRKISISGIGTKAITEAVDFQFEQIPFCVASDNIQVYEINGLTNKAITEEMHMFIESLSLKRKTEDGGQRITEDGGRRISE